MDINLVKYVINGANLVKIGHFWWKWTKSGHFGCKNDIIYVNFWESGQIIFSQKVSKNYSSQVYGQKSGKNVINYINLVKICHFWWKWSKSGHFGIFWAPRWRHISKFWESCQIIFSLNVSKNYFSQVYGQKSGQKCR